MSSKIDHIQCEAQLRWLLISVMNEAVAANLALERMAEMGYVSRESAAAAWAQEKNSLVNRAVLSLSPVQELNEG